MTSILAPVFPIALDAIADLFAPAAIAQHLGFVPKGAGDAPQHLTAV